MASSTSDLSFSRLTKSELLSIASKYPEINFDSMTQTMTAPSEQDECKDPPDNASPNAKTTANVNSSPPSSHHDEHDTDESRITCSTARTTPLKHIVFREDSQPYNPYADYLNVVNNCDLSDVTKLYFRSVADEMVNIGNKLQNVYQNREPEGGLDALVEQITKLNRMIMESTKNCNDQADTIAWMVELAPFTIVPTDVALWSIYRQRAALIIKHCSCPSMTEYRIIKSVIHIHDAYIHSDYLHRVRTSPITWRPPYAVHLNELLHVVHNWFTAEKRWAQGMFDLKRKYMSPLMRRIQESEWVKREIEQTEQAVLAAQAKLKARYDSGEIEKVLREDRERGKVMLKDGRSRSSVLPDGEVEVAVKDFAEKLAIKDGEDKKVAVADGSKGVSRAATRVRREHTM